MQSAREHRPGHRRPHSRLLVLVLSCVGALSRKRRDGRHPSFNVIDIEADRFNIALYPWDVSAREFRTVETHAFARHVTYQDIDVPPSPATVASHG